MKKLQINTYKLNLKSQIVEEEQLKKKDTMQPNQEDHEAYEQLMHNWKNRQRQSLRVNQNGVTQTVYIYDPNNPNFEVYKKPVSEDRTDIFQKFTPQIIKYLNAKFIVEEIIQTIQKYKIIDQEILQNVQFMYLLAFRAWCQINFVLKTFNQRKSKSQQVYNRKAKKHMTKVQFIFNSQDINLKYLVEPMIKLSAKIDVIFQQYHKILTLKQHYLKNKLKAIFDFIFHHKYKNIKDTFLCGFEGMDFSRQQQINYLHENYISEVIDQLKTFQGVKYKLLIEKLAIFKSLMNAKIEKLEGYDDYQLLKQNLINQQGAKTENETGK